MCVPEHIISDGTAPSRATSAFRVLPSVSNHGWKGASFGFSKKHIKRRSNYGKEANFGDPDRP